MDNIIIDYQHRSEDNDMYLIMMSLPKIDRVGMPPKVWRWR